MSAARLFLLCLLVVNLPFINAAHAASDARGLKAVAIDKTTQQQSEVKLYDKSYAVIIGIDQYKYLPPDRQLKFAVHDAQGIEATLKKHYKFDQIVSLFNQDATRARILDLLTEELPAKMGDNDALFVFFAGHGDQIKRGRDEIGYLIPHDGQVGRLSSVISMADLRDTVSKAIPAKHVFYVVDACYGGLLTATRSIDKTPRRDLEYLKEIAREPVRQVLTAGGKGEEVLDGGANGHSVFTGRLIEALERAGDFITANEIQAILREKVYGDARARNYTQTPAYGTLSGSGDFVFVPSLEQKAADNRGEIAKLQAELKALEDAELHAKAANAQAKASEARRAAERKLQAEQLKQQQLIAEQKQHEAEAAERERLLAARDKDVKHLAELKAAAESRRKQQTAQQAQDAFPTLDAAVTEIRRLNQQIAQIEERYKGEIGPTRERVEARYAERLARLDTKPRDEFESDKMFKARIEQRRDELKRQRETELQGLTLEQLAVDEVSPLKARIQVLAEREYVLEGASIKVDLGSYDADKAVFQVALNASHEVKDDAREAPKFSFSSLWKKRNQSADSNLAGASIKFAVNGTLPLPPDEARQFKQHWTAGLVRAEVTASPMSGVKTVHLVNEADGSRRRHSADEFMTEAEWRERQERQYRPAMLAITAGSFMMGSTDGGSDEKPVHSVSVPAFEMAQTEVTQAQWQAVMGGNPSNFKGCESCPVEMVSWDDIQDYLRKLNAKTGKQYRLPSEAEWEYACRSGGSYTYCGSHTLGDVAWFYDNSDRKTHPVGQKQANAFGLYDMSGNVWEWVADCWNSNYAGVPSDGSAWMRGECGSRVLRGASWLDTPGNARAAYRGRYTSGFRDFNSGFRLASPRRAQ